MKLKEKEELQLKEAENRAIYDIMGVFCKDRELPQISRDDVELCEVIGKGAFGKVFTGFYKKSGEDGVEMPVAVKTLTQTCSTQEESDYYLEALIMSKFDHPNIVRLIGVCFDKHPRLIVLELLKGGDLRNFLREHRPNKSPAKPPLTMVDLLRCAADVVSGCVYLEQNRFIHRDIAARNCLLTGTGPERVVKIADFGLARDCYRCDYYKKGGRTMLPVKWMPPEAFQDGIFSVKTDVWAFGILLWEIFSLGFMPYQGLGNREVMGLVVKGGRMGPPENCPPPIYGLMLRCWMQDPADRPSFVVIRERIGYCLQDPEVIRAPLPIQYGIPSIDEDPFVRPVKLDWDRFELYRAPPAFPYAWVEGASTSRKVMDGPSTSREDVCTPSSRISFSDSNDRSRRSQEIELNELCLKPDEIVVLETTFTDPENLTYLQSHPIQSIQISEISPEEERIQQESAFCRPEETSRGISPRRDTAFCSYFKDKLQQKKKAFGFRGKGSELPPTKLPRITGKVEVVAERTYVKPKKKIRSDPSYTLPVPERFDIPLKALNLDGEEPLEVSEYSTFRDDIQAFIEDKKCLNNDGDTDDDQYVEERERIPPHLLPDNNARANDEFAAALQASGNDKAIDVFSNRSSPKATSEERGKRPLDKIRVPYKKSSQKKPEDLETIDESNI